MSDKSAEQKCKTCRGTGTVADYVGLEMRCVEAECPECKGIGHKRDETKEAGMTAAEMEQYVRERWEWFASFDLSDEENREDNDPEWLVKVCDATAGSPIEFYGATAAEAWTAAYAFTVERERQIEEKREEIVLVGEIATIPQSMMELYAKKELEFSLEFIANREIAQRILAILEAQLADLQRGMKEPK